MVGNVRAYTEVGHRIAALGKRQKHIARVLGVTQQTVSEKLRGECAILLSDLEKLSKAYGVPLTYFVEEGAGDPELAAAVERVRTERGPLRDLVTFACELQPSDQEKLLVIARTLAVRQGGWPQLDDGEESQSSCFARMTARAASPANASSTDADPME
ncbi:MAG: helix-turn-helix domain-containing protein [Planctomycetota bacterium]|jgi:transcriptional regulator with XRE-family HTH domain